MFLDYLDDLFDNYLAADGCFINIDSFIAIVSLPYSGRIDIITQRELLESGLYAIFKSKNGDKDIVVNKTIPKDEILPFKNSKIKYYLHRNDLFNIWKETHKDEWDMQKLIAKLNMDEALR